jgi:aspartyl-tRNA(Asn)/glutamyl-tRNA(Gln) amidotransferase subunit A
MLKSLGIRELGALLRAREVTAVEIAGETLAMVEREEPRLNAYITITAERALAEAAVIDDSIGRGEDLGPLMGIPWAIKDVFATDGAPTTGGSSALREYAPSPDAAIVRRMRESGAVLIGKTNLHELGWGLSREIGRTNNPHDVALGSGGSSGGSAATVACGALPVAIGTDGGGSVRMPAAYCGVVGLKPTHARLPVDGHLPAAWSVGDAGPLARSVADVADVYAIFQADRGDTVPKAPRIAFVADETCEAMSAEIADALRVARTRLEETFDVELVRLDLTGAFSAWALTYAAELSAALRHWLDDRLTATSPELQEMVAMGHAVPAPAYLRAQRFRTKLYLAVESIFRTHDMLVTPAVLGPPPATESYWADDTESTGNSWLSPFNLTGHPALTLPLGRPGSGAALQLVGPWGRDHALLRAAAAVESALEPLQAASSRATA